MAKIRNHNTILYEYGPYRLYSKRKTNETVTTVYFITELQCDVKRLRRLKISAAFAHDLEELSEEAFSAKVRSTLDTARENGTPEYYEVKI